MNDPNDHTPEHDLEPADDLGRPETDEALTDAHHRVDYIAVDGTTVVSVFTFDDGSALKAWTTDGGQTYTTRQIKTDGHAVYGTTIANRTAQHVNDLVDAYAEALETRRA